MKRIAILVAVLAVFLWIGLPFTNSSAIAYTVDGDISDWGINLNLAVGQGYLDANVPTGGLDIDYVTEDNTDISKGWVNVGPGWSLKNTYDAEAIYFDNDATHGYIAIITGLPVSDTWGPGDIGIDVSSSNADLLDQDNNAPYDPAKTTSYEYGIDLDGKTLKNVTSWNAAYYDGSPNPNFAAASDPWAINSGAVIGNVDLVYAANPIEGHYVIETSFLLADLGLQPGDLFGIHWTMKCGNDFLNLRADVNPVPEPATMFLFGTGLIGLAGLGRKKFLKKG